LSVVSIESIAIDEVGRLLVTPALELEANYAFIYRAALGVAWEEASKSLVAPAPKDRSYIDWFLNICGAVRSEYGDELVLVPETQWKGVSQSLQREIKQLAAANET
jgi:hypothetical protein